MNARVVVTFTLFAALMGLLAIPWRSAVELPATFEARRTSVLFAAVPGRITEIRVRNGATVERDAVVVRIEKPDLDHRLRQLRRQVTSLRWQLTRIESLDATSDQAGIFRQELLRVLTSIDGLTSERARLDVSTPIAGRLADLDPTLHVGQWIGGGTAIAMVLDTAGAKVVGYVTEQDLLRIAVGARGTFHPDAMNVDPFAVEVRSIDGTNTTRLKTAVLASEYGGPVGVRTGPDDRAMIPEQTIYRVEMIPGEDAPQPKFVLRGVAVIEGEPVSLAVRAFRFAAGVLIRESGF